VLGAVPADGTNILAELKKPKSPLLAYGSIITVSVNFTILAFIIFLITKWLLNSAKFSPRFHRVL
jgi:large conductance mechanosensitive channel